MVQATEDHEMRDQEDQEHEHDQSGLKVGEPLEILMIEQDKFYLWSN